MVLLASILSLLFGIIISMMFDYGVQTILFLVGLACLQFYLMKSSKDSSKYFASVGKQDELLAISQKSLNLAKVAYFSDIFLVCGFSIGNTVKFLMI